MFKIIASLIQEKNEHKIENNIDISAEIIQLNIVYDMITQKPIITLNINLSNPTSEKFIDQAEAVSIFLFNLCENNTYIIDLVLDAINKFKALSNSHALFANNVLFLWDKLINNHIYTDKTTEPVIKPSHVFRQLDNHQL